MMFSSFSVKHFVIIILTITETYIINVVTTQSNSCTIVTRFVLVESLNDLVVEEPSLIKIPHVFTISNCAIMCSGDSRCLSFYYNKQTATCDLRDHVTGAAPTTTSEPGSKHFVVNSGCSTLPTTTIPHGQPASTSTLMWRTGGTTPVTCDPQHVLHGELQCTGENTWNIPFCAIPSCSALNICNSSAVDGEYWLFPAILQGQKVKVYCSSMTTGTPKEYITLYANNSGQVPNLSNLNCKGETDAICPDWVGVVSYRKIQIDLTTMAVDTEDSTFSERTSSKTWPYGTARDCYAIHYGGNPACGGPKGTFTINTTRTGLKVSPTVTWKTSGWKSYQIVNRSDDGVAVSLTCGGWTGSCASDGPLLLTLNNNEHLPENSATLAEC